MRKDVGALVENNMPLVHKVIKDCVHMPPGMLRNEYDDLFQIGSIALWEAAKAYDPGSGYAFSTLAYTCIRNSLYKELEKAHRYREVQPDEEFWELLSANPSSPLDALEISELLKYCTEGIRTIEEKKGLNFNAKKLSGFSYDEIEERSGMSKNRIYYCVNRAKNVLRKRHLEYVS